MNRSQLIGNLTRDPEQRMTGSGISVATFTVAVQRKFADANGERKADFFNCVAFRALAENTAKYVKKGSKVFVGGALQNRSYDDKDGNKRYVTEIICDEVEFLDKARGAKHDTEPQYEAVDDEDLPF